MLKISCKFLKKNFVIFLSVCLLGEAIVSSNVFAVSKNYSMAKNSRDVRATRAEYVRNLQEILRETGAKWTAKDYPFFDEMSEAKLQNIMGLFPAPYDRAAVAKKTITPSRNRDRDALPLEYTAPHTGVKKQGGCGSCYAFTICAIFETFRKIKEGINYDFSEQAFMMDAKEWEENHKKPGEGTYGGCYGWYPDRAMNLLRDKGLIYEEDAPYKGEETEYITTDKKRWKINKWEVRTELEDIKEGIVKYGAGFTGMYVTEDFKSYGYGVYSYASGPILGGHAVTLIGYNDFEKAFLVKNSWGPDWGENGLFWIAYDQMNSCVEFTKPSRGVYFIKG